MSQPMLMEFERLAYVPRFLVFCWINNRAKGGWGDLMGWSPTQQGAMDIAESKKKIYYESLKMQRALEGDISFLDKFDPMMGEFCSTIIDMQYGKNLGEDETKWEYRKWDGKQFKIVPLTGEEK